MIAVNRPVSVAMAEQVAEVFTEVIVAPAYDEGAVDGPPGQEEHPDPAARRAAAAWVWSSARSAAGPWCRSRDTIEAEGDDPRPWTLATGEPASEEVLADLAFAWRACRSVKSNAILLASGGASVGIGMGQVNRVDSCKLAVERAGERAAGSVAASDAFFPFEDGPQILIDAGVTAIVQPGGSVRDELTVAGLRGRRRDDVLHRHPPLRALATGPMARRHDATAATHDDRMTSVTAQTLDGAATLAAIKAELTQRVAKLKEHGIVPGLGTVLVGDDPGSHWYVGAKHKDCAEIGITSLRRDLPATATQAEVEAVIDELNADPACTGFLVQQPTGLDEFALLSRVDPDKDVDGLHPVSLGKLVLGEPGSLPCTPVGCIELLRRHGVELAGAEVVVVGRGITVGRPLGLLLTRRTENATVTQCHTGTRDLAAHTRNADIVVAAAGVPGIITGDMVKPGAAVLDVGVSRVDGRIAGDVDASVWDVAGWVSPNPRGVGPMTRAMLLSNIVEIAERSLG